MCVYTYVCVCVHGIYCARTHIHTCTGLWEANTHVLAYVCVCLYRICMDVCVGVCVCVHTHAQGCGRPTRMWLHMCVCLYRICMDVCTCVYALAHTHKNMHMTMRSGYLINISIHTCIDTCAQSLLTRHKHMHMTVRSGYLMNIFWCILGRAVMSL